MMAGGIPFGEVGLLTEIAVPQLSFCLSGGISVQRTPCFLNRDGSLDDALGSLRGADQRLGKLRLPLGRRCADVCWLQFDDDSASNSGGVR